MTQQHTPLEPLTDLDRARLDHGVTLATRELAKRQAAEDRQQQAARDNAERVVTPLSPLAEIDAYNRDMAKRRGEA